MLQIRIVPSKPALILEGKKKYLIVTDIHIGFENRLASNDIFIGKNSTINETIQELLENDSLKEVSVLDDIDGALLPGLLSSSLKRSRRCHSQQLAQSPCYVMRCCSHGGIDDSVPLQTLCLCRSGQHHQLFSGAEKNSDPESKMGKYESQSDPVLSGKLWLHRLIHRTGILLPHSRLQRMRALHNPEILRRCAPPE